MDVVGGNRWTAVLISLALFGALGSASADTPAREWARYEFLGASAYRYVRAAESSGYQVALSSRDGKSLEALIKVDGLSLPDAALLPIDAALLPPDAQAVLKGARPQDDEIEKRSRLLLNEARTVLEAVEIVIGFTSRRIRYEGPGPFPETAARCLESGRGSCVGRSLLAAELLLRFGIPARQVTGVLVAKTEDELAPDARPYFSARLGGVRHRWIEVFVPGLGWVPSDPAGLANTVTSRHLPLERPPSFEFGVRVLERSPAMKLPRLDSKWTGVIAGRQRASSLKVTHRTASGGGAVVLSPAGRGRASEKVMVARAEGPSVLFESVPAGDYRVIWKTPDGKVEAASLRVDGPASVELPLDRDGGR